jgi:hypothetical protein
VHIAFDHAGLDMEKFVVIDPTFYRPAEVDVLLAIPARRGAFGWEPEINLDQMIREMVDADLSVCGARRRSNQKGRDDGRLQRILVTGAPDLSAAISPPPWPKPTPRRRGRCCCAPASAGHPAFDAVADLVDEGAIDALIARLAPTSSSISPDNHRPGAAGRRGDLAVNFHGTFALGSRLRHARARSFSLSDGGRLWRKLP